MEAVIQKTTEKVYTGTATVFHSKANGESQRKEELFMLNKIEKKVLLEQLEDLKEIAYEDSLQLRFSVLGGGKKNRVRNN